MKTEEEKQRYRNAYAEEVSKGSYFGRLRAFDDYGYDGTDEYWAGRTWSIDYEKATDNGIVSMEIEDIFKQFEDKKIVLTIEVVE